MTRVPLTELGWRVNHFQFPEKVEVYERALAKSLRAPTSLVLPARFVLSHLGEKMTA